jgi:hypothetical protein
MGSTVAKKDQKNSKKDHKKAPAKKEPEKKAPGKGKK